MSSSNKNWWFVMVACAALFACEPRSFEPIDIAISARALVSTIDGVYFYPPLAPSPSVSGTADLTLMSSLTVVVQSTNSAGGTTTVATFNGATTPAIVLNPTAGFYFVDIP